MYCKSLTKILCSGT